MYNLDKYLKPIFLWALVLICTALPVSAKEFEVTYFAEEANRDVYYRELIKLALDKTQSKYGDYKLTIIANVPTQRRFAFLQQNKLPNATVLRGYDRNFHASGNLTYINFPIDLGLLGMRICFVSPQSKDKIARVKSLNELRQFSIVQGIGWADNEILRENGFTVIELDGYENLFKMVISGRTDLFCRGVNELPNEYREHRSIGNLIYDESFIIRYSMPYFLFINAENTLAKQRLEEGLKIAYADGSLTQLWYAKYGDILAFANFKNRKVFDLKNSNVDSLSKEYEKYLVNPETLK